MTTDDDMDLIRRVLERNRELSDIESPRTLYQNEVEVFGEWLKRGRPLSEKQQNWLAGAAVRLDVITEAPAANVFSSMDERKKKVELERAARVVVNSGEKVLRPPGRK